MVMCERGYRKCIQSQKITRLKSKVYSLERLYPLSPVEVSKFQTKIWSEKKSWVRNNFGSKNFWSKEIVGPKNFGPYRFCVWKNFRKKLCLKKNFEKILGAKKLCLKKKFENNFGSGKKFWVWKKNLGLKKILGSEKILGSK